MENSVLIDQYRKWVIQRGTESFPVTENDEGNLEIESTVGLGRVNFYPDDIVELRIDTIRDNKCEFFLHFQLKDLKRAKELYLEMEEAMRNMKDNKAIDVLLTCSSALTTSYYAELLNKAAETLGKNYSFRAVSFDKIEAEGENADVILLAPQVHYARSKVMALFDHAIVINIPAQTFGKYDTGTLIELIKGELEEKQTKETPKYQRTQSFFETNKKILTIGYINGGDLKQHVISRYYKNGNIEYFDETVVENVNIEDIIRIAGNIIDMYPEIEVVGLSLPGAIESGVIYLENHPIHMHNIEQEVSSEIHRDVFAFNDANMIVTGIYWLEDRYKSLILYFLPDGAEAAGCGIVINGHMIRGYQHVAGEVKFTQDVLNINHSVEEIKDTEAGALEVISKTLVTMVATVGPEAIFVYSSKLKDMDKLKDDMSKYIDPKFIPDLLHVDDIREYMMTGTFLRCIWKLDDIKRKKFGLTHNPYQG